MRKSSLKRCAKPLHNSARISRGKRLRQKGRRVQEREAGWRKARAAALDRAGHACERCGGKDRVAPHHRQPRSRGGSDEPSNLAALCWRCHRAVHDHLCDDWRDWIRLA